MRLALSLCLSACSCTRLLCLSLSLKDRACHLPTCSGLFPVSPRPAPRGFRSHRGSWGEGQGGREKPARESGPLSCAGGSSQGHQAIRPHLLRPGHPEATHASPLCLQDQLCHDLTILVPWMCRKRTRAGLTSWPEGQPGWASGMPGQGSSAQPGSASPPQATIQPRSLRAASPTGWDSDIFLALPPKKGHGLSP